MAKYILTREGYQNLINEQEELKVKRIPAVERLKRARDMGDLSENSEYHAAKEDLANIEGRMQEIDEIQRDVEIVKAQPASGSVTIGNTVEVEVDGKKSTYMIVGEMEANFAENKLSYLSPIGKAFLGASKGQQVTITTPSGKVVYKILDIK